jgi:hypothetical protein
MVVEFWLVVSCILLNRVGLMVFDVAVVSIALGSLKYLAFSTCGVYGLTTGFTAGLGVVIVTMV